GAGGVSGGSLSKAGPMDQPTAAHLEQPSAATTDAAWTRAQAANAPSASPPTPRRSCRTTSRPSAAGHDDHHVADDRDAGGDVPRMLRPPEDRDRPGVRRSARARRSAAALLLLPGTRPHRGAARAW